MLHCPTCGQDFAEEVVVCPEDGALLQADATIAMDIPEDPLIGLTLDGKYRLDSRIGTGGMGTVYRATHLLIDRPVAIKVLNPRYVEDEAAQTRFRREARAAGRLQHTNAVTVTDFGSTPEGFVYIVMELLEGHTLRDVLARDAPLDTARAVSMMLQISAAVGAAHDAGIIHRDLKPANIFIVQRKDAPPFVKVLDFGIAKLAADAVDEDDVQTLTQVGAMIGTPRYMSPEQCEGVKLTPAADVYSLGIILYEMLTGSTPFTGTTPIAIAIKHSTTPPRRPREIVASIPVALEEVVLHALEKSPENRPADANAFRQELYAVAERLGLEHAASLSAPTFETLRNAGVPTPSGRLVIDLERMRESRAAANAAQSTPVAAPPAPPPAPEREVQPDNGAYQPPPVVVAAAAAAPPPAPAPNAYVPPQAIAPGAYVPPFAAPAGPPPVSRFNVPVAKNGTGRGSRLGTILLVSTVVFLLLAGGAAWMMARSSGKLIQASNAGEALNRVESFGNGNIDWDGILSGGKNGKEDNAQEAGGRSRNSRDAEKSAHGRQPGQPPSKLKRMWNKAKNIFKSPF